MNNRKIKRIVKGYKTIDGAGVKLIRVLGHDDVYDVDPFLMMDTFGSKNPEDYIKGFPMHPHRGIETITYLIEGSIDHEDSVGNKGTINSGELQWMTSGSGIMHEEMPRRTEKLEGLQFWLNLPGKDKMTVPTYFPIMKEDIVDIDIPSGKVKLIAGEYDEYKGIQGKYVKITMLDVELKPDGQMNIPIPDGHTVFAYLLNGDGTFDESETVVKEHMAVIFEKHGSVEVKAGKYGVHFVLLSGEPLGEQIAWAGPIVMNTDEELKVAFEELKNGSFIKSN